MLPLQLLLQLLLLLLLFKFSCMFEDIRWENKIENYWKEEGEEN